MLTERVVHSIRYAAESVFGTMLGLPLESGTAYLERSGAPGFDGVVALVGLAGSWTGAGKVCFSAPFACRLSSALLDSECAAVNDEVLDAVAEVANMIIGNTKSLIEPEVGPIALSIPTVVYGRSYITPSAGAGSWTVVPFLCGGERIEVKLCLTPEAASTRSRAKLSWGQAMDVAP